MILKKKWRAFAGVACLSLFGCAERPVSESPAPVPAPRNPYESASAAEQARMKRVRLAFPAGTRFRISQGAFGAKTHSDRGHEYTWDFDVPLNTPVTAVEGGTVIAVWEPKRGGGCDPAFGALAHNLKIRHADGTVAQYVHIQSEVKAGKHVRAGERIAVTGRNGFLCTPQLDLGIYRSERHLYGTREVETIPTRFSGIPGELAREGYEGAVPEEKCKEDFRRMGDPTTK